MTVELFVNGTLMRGLALHQLAEGRNRDISKFGGWRAYRAALKRGEG